MAKTPQKAPTAPADELRSLVERLKIWQPYFIAAFVFLLGCAGWFALQVHNAQVSIAKLEGLPVDVRDIGKRTNAIETELGGLKQLPEHINKVNAAVTEARAELNAISKSAADLNAAASKLEDLSSSVAAVAAKQAEQKKLADEIKASVAGITSRLQEQSERIADVKRQISTTMPTPEAAEKRLLTQFLLPEKPNGSSEDGDKGRLIYEVDFKVPAIASAGVTRVEFVDFRSERELPSLAPFTFAVDASLLTSEKKKKLRLSVYTDNPDEFMAFHQKGKVVAMVAIFYR